MSDLETRKRNAELRRDAIADHARTRPPINLSQDPLAELRREALLVCGYHPEHKGEITAGSMVDPGHTLAIEATLGRCLIRYLNAKARAN